MCAIRNSKHSKQPMNKEQTMNEMNTYKVTKKLTTLTIFYASRAAIVISLLQLFPICDISMVFRHSLASIHSTTKKTKKNSNFH